MDQPPALHTAEAAVSEPAPTAGALVWESDLADLAALPLTAVDGLTPLSPPARLLEEVLRSRSGISGGGETGGRAD
ncbi:hypothetical protein [Streptomyces sp. S.PNR 29]|uniref:hypothetical protein n=1 Tax=Streptomyces sp. S.PNR 29 TaxID=2973805 RepID=UPI0025B1A37C|nr:hypothetical protein [Streptomyces sp. S.PNR 29]MDN0197446.1 hypothetical protein [Streptomyces sp. S.PNR 29]